MSEINNPLSDIEEGESLTFSGQQIEYLREEKPLGTAGGLRLIYKKMKKDFFVTNCDTIIKTDLNSIYDFHKKNKQYIWNQNPLFRLYLRKSFFI